LKGKIAVVMAVRCQKAIIGGGVAFIDDLLQRLQLAGCQLNRFRDQTSAAVGLKRLKQTFGALAHLSGLGEVFPEECNFVVQLLWVGLHDVAVRESPRLESLASHQLGRIALP
jgi:hypothetical protein